MNFRFPSATPPAPSRAEVALLAAVAALLALAAFGPPLALPAHYHAFADQRPLWGLPCAMDVLSNLGFVLAGAAGLWRLRRAPTAAIAPAPRALAALFFVGLALTAAGSAGYHLRPDDAGLALDRATMGVAFAGLLGLAVADRLSARAGLALAGLTLVLAPLAAGLPLVNGNMGPWAVLQGGGALLLVALAFRRPQPAALGFSLAAVLALYAVAKALELGDHAVFELTDGLVSGHSLKHLVAAGAAITVGRALRRTRAVTPGGQNDAQTAPARAPQPSRTV